MTEKILTPKGAPKAVGLHGLIEEFNLKIPLPMVRSEVISGARRTTVADDTVLEQYPVKQAQQGCSFPAHSFGQALMLLLCGSVNAKH